MIVNIRGCNGSGKSTLVREVMSLGEFKPVHVGENRKGPIVVGYSGEVKGMGTVGIVGRYETACGGCDTIKTQDEVVERVRAFNDTHHHVFFEGVIVSDCYARYADLAREIPPMILGWMDTPLDVCLARVMARREAKGTSAEGFKTDLVEQKWNNARRQYDRAVLQSVLGDWIPHMQGMMWVRSWLKVER